MSPALKCVETHRVALYETMGALHALGYSLLPLGVGENGKAPAVKFKGRKRLPIGTVISIMRRHGSTMFGIRTDGLVVVDKDSNDLATRDYCERRFGVSDFVVKTRRGEHHYFRSGDQPTKNIRSAGVDVDIKHGSDMFVVGPGSIRPDTGDVYSMGNPLPAIRDLPIFCDHGDPIDKPGQTDSQVVAIGQLAKIPKGERTFNLWARARELVECHDNEQSLFEDLRAYCDWHFDDGHAYSDERIWKSVKWTWEARLENRLLGGRKSIARIYHHEVTAILATSSRYGGNALALLHVLHHCHAGQPGKRFSLATKAMAKQNVIEGWTQWQYRTAIDALLEAGLLSRNLVDGKAKYQLMRLPVA
ncbi:MAG: hypothetical protein AAF724_07100 [Pseudomonadota bacterium]